jgi:hypothetical protein
METPPERSHANRNQVLGNRFFITGFHIPAAVRVFLDPAVDVKIRRNEEPVRFVVAEHLDFLEIFFLVKDQDLFSNQGDGSFVEFVV